jgi:hypothetical protein
VFLRERLRPEIRSSHDPVGALKRASAIADTREDHGVLAAHSRPLDKVAQATGPAPPADLEMDRAEPSPRVRSDFETLAHEAPCLPAPPEASHRLDPARYGMSVSRIGMPRLHMVWAGRAEDEVRLAGQALAFPADCRGWRSLCDRPKALAGPERVVRDTRAVLAADPVAAAQAAPGALAVDGQHGVS